MKRYEENICLCTLNRIFGFEPKTAHALLAKVGDAGELFRMSKESIDGLLGPYSKHKGLITIKAYEDTERELEELDRKGIRFSGYSSTDYPELLKECPDSPLGLYIRGTGTYGDIFGKKRSIAVIGTRDLSSYGREWCGRIMAGIASTGEKPLIVSGLALGTDICAHLAALDAGLPTIAVMATGPDSVYPYRHREFAERIAQTPGCALITDYPPGTAPLPIHFLRRNRIIAGMSEAVVLIESRIKGGGMMTSRLAFSYDRDVYALPGRIDDPRSQGCNMLIKEKMAEPIVSAENLAESLGLGIVRKSRQKSDREMLSERFGDHADETEIFQMEKIISVIRKNRDIFLDELGDMMQMDQAAVISLTGLLEMEGFIHIDMLRRCSICSKR